MNAKVSGKILKRNRIFMQPESIFYIYNWGGFTMSPNSLIVGLGNLLQTEGRMGRMGRKSNFLAEKSSRLLLTKG